MCSCACPPCTPPLLAGVCGVGVCVWARVSAAPRHSWLSCWAVCVLVCALRLHPATPGWGVRCGCVCLGFGFGCAPPLLAGVLGCVCAPVRAPPAPSHSWHGCAVWVCVFGLGLRLRPATPAWGVRCGCVCSGSGFGCTPPLLAWVFGCVCARMRASLAPSHSWLGCAARVFVFGLGFGLCPATPGWGVGLCVCSCARSACIPPLLLGVRAVGVCVWARISAAPRHSWLGCWGVCVLVCVPPLYPATPGWRARRGCVCLGSGFGCAPPLLAGVLGFVCAGVGAPLAPSHSWHGCAVWVCVFELWFRLRPATSGWGVGVCVRWCGRSACTPPLLAGVRAVGVCVWPRVSAAPRHSWLGGWAVCVLVWPLRLHPATPGWGARRGCVCLGSGFVCTPPLLAGVLGCVCAGVGGLLATRHSWLGCAPWVCVFGLGFRLRPATPGWGVGVCVCSCACPLLYPASPGWGVRCGCVCLGSCFGCAPPLLAGVLGCVYAGMRAPPVPRLSWLGCAAGVCVLGPGFWLRPVTPGWAVGLCVCSCARSACTLPLLAGLRGLGVCVWAPVLAAPRHSLLGCWAVCVLLCALRLHPASPGWGARSVSLCVWARVSAAPRHSWLGCWPLCVLVCALRLHPASPGMGARCGCVCLGSGFGCAPPLLAGVCVVECVLGHGFWLRPATPGCDLWCLGWLWPGTCSCAVHRCVLCAHSGCVAPGGRHCLAPVRVPWLWPAACLSGVPRVPAWCAAPRPVRSLSVLWSAFPSPWCLSPSRGLAPRALLGRCAGHAEAGREPGSLCLPLAPAKAGALGPLRVVPIRGPAMGLSLAGPSGIGLGLRALRWLAFVDPVTDASGFPDRRSFDGGPGRCTGAVSCGR